MRPSVGSPRLPGVIALAPSLAALAESWGFVIVDRIPGGVPGTVLAPMSIGFFGDIGKRDAYELSPRGGITIDTPFDYQAAWVPATDDTGAKAVTRRIDLAPSEGFALESLVVERYQCIVHASELTEVALERARRPLVAAWEMREHFIAKGRKSLLSSLP